jgi:Mg/Co/Ni transporter MgtE
MAKIRTDATDGLTVEAVMHAKLSTLPATATVGDVRDYFTASPSRRVAYVVDEDGRYVGSLTPAQVADGDGTAPAAEVAETGLTVTPDQSAATGRDIALLTDARRVAVVADGRLVGVVAITGDLQNFCGTG